METLSFIINRFSVELKFVSRKKEKEFSLFDLVLVSCFLRRFLWFDSRQNKQWLRRGANDKLSDIHVIFLGINVEGNSLIM